MAETNDQLESFLKGEPAPDEPVAAAAPEPKAPEPPKEPPKPPETEPEDEGEPPKPLEGEDVVPYRAWRPNGPSGRTTWRKPPSLRPSATCSPSSSRS